MFYKLFSRTAPTGALRGPSPGAHGAGLSALRAGSAAARRLGSALLRLLRISAWTYFGDFLIWLDFGFWLALAGFDLDFGWIWLDLAFVH